MTHARVRSHARHTRYGKVAVRAHGRRVSLPDRLSATGRRGGGELPPALSALAVSGLLLAVWGLSAVMSVAAAVLSVVASAALGFLAWQVRPTPTPKRRRPQSTTFRRRRRLVLYRLRRRLARWAQKRGRRARVEPASAHPVRPQRERKAG